MKKILVNYFIIISKLKKLKKNKNIILFIKNFRKRKMMIIMKNKIKFCRNKYQKNSRLITH